MPSTPIRQPIQSYGPPQPTHVHGAGCDGWKPIPGPSIGVQAIANSNNAQIQSIDNSYLPPLTNNLPLADNININVQPLPTNLQLPNVEAPKFHDDSGLGLTNFNIIKSEGIEVCIKF